MLEIAATGFCNPHDLDFNAAGRLFTADADNERDVGLPWYTPAPPCSTSRGAAIMVGLPQGASKIEEPARLFLAGVSRSVNWGRAQTGLTFYRHRRFFRAVGSTQCLFDVGPVHLSARAARFFVHGPVGVV